MEMTGKEKLYFLMDAVDDARVLAPSGQPVLIHPYKDLVMKYTDVELRQLFTKLEVDEKIIKVLDAPTSSPNSSLSDPYANPEDEYYHLEILPAFDNYFLKIQKEEEYQDFTGKKRKNKTENNKPSNQPTNYNRKALEKIWGILQEIEELRQISSSNSKLRMLYIPSGFQGAQYVLDRIIENKSAVLEKLQEEKAIKNLDHTTGIDGFWIFEIGDKYFDVLSEHEEKYKKIAQNYQQNREEEKTEIKDTVYEVKYSEKSREILVNGFLLAKPDFNSENEVVFSHLYKNVNRSVKTEELEQLLGGKLKKPIHNILRDLGFTGKFAKVFFSASKNGVVFRNPITYQDLKDLGIERIKIQEKK